MESEPSRSPILPVVYLRAVTLTIVNQLAGVEMVPARAFGVKTTPPGVSPICYPALLHNHEQRVIETSSALLVPRPVVSSGLPSQCHLPGNCTPVGAFTA
jgi:hypothetical protein